MHRIGKNRNGGDMRPLGLVLLLLLVGTRVPAQDSAKGEVVLKFPEERAIGMLLVRPATAPGTTDENAPPWRPLGMAQGELRVEPGTELLMRVADQRVVEFLSDPYVCKTLGPHDLRGGVTPDSLEQLGSVAIHTLSLGSLNLSDGELKHVSGLVSLRALDLSNNPIKGPGLEHLKSLEHLEAIDLQGTDLDDAGLSSLASLKRLRRLNVSGGRARGPGWSVLSGLPLEELHLQFVPNPDEAMKGLAGNAAMRRLVVANSGLTDEGLRAIARLEGLENLFLIESKVTSGGFSDLSSLGRLTRLALACPQLGTELIPVVAAIPSLRHLQVFSVEWDDAALAELTRLENLETLALEGNGVTDDGLLEHVPRFPRLTSVTVMSESVTDESLEVFRGNKNLVSLDLSGTNVSVEALQELKATLAEGCEVRLPQFRFPNWKPPATKARKAEDRERYPARTLRFPEEGVPGLMLWHRAASDSGRGGESIEPRGEVAIPAGQWAWTGVSDETELEVIEKLAPGDIQRLSLFRASPPFQRLERLRRLNLEELMIDSPHVRDRQLALLAKFTTLRKLELRGCRIDGSGLEALASLPELRELDLDSTYVDDRGLLALESLPHLRSLNLSGPRFTDACIPALERLAGLERVRAYETGITLAGADRLRAARPGLELDHYETEPLPPQGVSFEAPYDGPTVTLDFPPYRTGFVRAWRKDADRWFWTEDGHGTLEAPAGEDVALTFHVEDSVTDFSFLAAMSDAAFIGLYFDRNRYLIDEDLRHVAGFKRLMHLGLGETEITDAGMAHLSGLENLAWLDISRTEVTGSGLRRIAKLPNLTDLEASGSRLDEKGLAILARMPLAAHRSALELPFRPESGREIPLSDIKLLAKFTALKQLTLQAPVPRSGLERIALLPTLERLILRGAVIADGDLGALRDAPKLVALWHPPDLSDEGFRALAGFPRLKEIGPMPLQAITDAGLADLEGFPALETLDIASPGVTDEGLSGLENFPSLKHVTLHGDRFTDKALERLARIPSLERLAISGAGITDEGLKSLEPAKHLKSLSIGGSTITDAGLEFLARLDGLEELSLPGSSVTREGMQRFREANPKLKREPASFPSGEF